MLIRPSEQATQKKLWKIKMTVKTEKFSFEWLDKEIV